MRAALRRDPAETAAERAVLAAHVAQNFTVEAMAGSVLDGYAEALARREGAR
jgi:hypothetical protein